MVFSSFEFIFLFLPLTLLIYIFSLKFKKEISIYILIVFSLLFYFISAKQWLFLIVLSLIFNSFISYFVRKKIVLIFAILVNLILIFFYKYNIVGLSISNYSIENIIIPLGISFYTFNQIVFLLDIYNGKIEKPKIKNFFFLISFFPHLIAGPFLRYNNIIDQFKNKTKMPFSIEKIKFGIFLFIIGLGKKVLIADTLGIYVDALHFSINSGLYPTFFQSWFGSTAFTLQLYFDFSGYSDMAIGLGLMFGIILPVNFNSPLKSSNIIQFWSKWHMTLTNLIREFIFFPLTININKKINADSKVKNYLFLIIIPTLITFSVIGLWHGGTVNFLLFGIYNALLIIIYQIFISKKNNKVSSNYFRKQFFIILNFLFINLGFIFFRSENFYSSIKLFKGMLGFNGLGVPFSLANKFEMLKVFKVEAIHFAHGYSSSSFLIMILIGLILCFNFKNYNFANNFLNEGYLFKFNRLNLILMYLVFVTSLLFLNRDVAFLYFNF